MKFTPFIVFLIILFIFVGLYIFIVNNKPSYREPEFQANRYEGFIDFENSISTNTFVKIPQYSDINSVLKLFDNIYFDNINGNLIEIDGIEVSANTEDTTGSTIQNLYITTRDDPTNVNTYSINGQTSNANIEDSYVQTVSNSYVAYSYQNQSAASSQSVTFYTAWQDLTCINVFSNTAIIDNNNNTPLTSINLLQNFLCIPGMTPQYTYIETTDFIDSTVPYYNDTDPNNNTFVIQPLYNPNVQVFQLSHFVQFDFTTGYLIMINGDNTNSITVYDSNGSVVNMNNPSTALINATNQVSFGSGYGIITPEQVSNSSCVNAFSAPTTSPSSAPIVPSTMNLQIDASQISSILGNFAKPFLSCLADTANSITAITAPPIVDFRSNFANAFIESYPGYGYQNAYNIADQIYNTDVPYYSTVANEGTIQGKIIGSKAFINNAGAVATTSSVATSLPTLASTIAPTLAPTMAPMTTPAPSTSYITTTVNTTANTPSLTTPNSQIMLNLEMFATLYAWGFHSNITSKNPTNTYSINLFFYGYNAAYNYASKNINDVASSILTAYYNGTQDNMLQNLASVYQLQTPTPPPSTINFNDIYSIIYAYGYITKNRPDLLNILNITDLNSFVSIFKTISNYFANNFSINAANIATAYTDGTNDGNASGKNIFSMKTSAAAAPTTASIKPVTESFTSSSSSTSIFNPFVLIDTYGQNVVIYNQIDTSDAIILIGSYSDATNQIFEIINAVRFMESGVDTGDNTTTKNGISMGNNSNLCLNPYKMVNNSDYILKSQIVPQMYNSTCSVCNGSGGACSNCGGNGGSGTMSSNGMSMVDNGTPDSTTPAQQQQQPQFIPQSGSNAGADTPLTNSSSSDFKPMKDDFSKFGR